MPEPQKENGQPTIDTLIDYKSGLADKEVNQEIAEKNVHKKGVVAKDVADYTNRPQQEPTNEQPRPEDVEERLVCTLVLVLLAVGVVLLSMALYSQDHDGLPILTMTTLSSTRRMILIGGPLQSTPTIRATRSVLMCALTAGSLVKEHTSLWVCTS